MLGAPAGCTHVITQNTPYYQDGPSQPDPPHGELAAGTKVWVVGKDGSYSRVWTLEGVDAYVWDGAIRPLWRPPKTPEQPKEGPREPEAVTTEGGS